MADYDKNFIVFKRLERFKNLYSTIRTCIQLKVLFQQCKQTAENNKT